MQKPLVSISLVAYNQGVFIREAIESCLNQQVNFDYEIIIHDDASNDNTASVILEFENKYPEKIIPIIETENQFSKGIEVNAKITIPRARGRYIAFLEADDYWIDPYKLQTQIDFMEKNPDIAMCFTATKRIFTNSSRKSQIKKYRNRDMICSIKDVVRLGGHLVDMGSAVVRRTVFNNIPDWYFCVQTWDQNIPLLSLLRGNIQYIDKVTSVYRYNLPGSWTRNNVKNLENRIINRKNNIKVIDGFDRDTNYKYHKYVNNKNAPIIIEVLLLSKEQDEDFSNLYSRLSFLSKLEYKVFRKLGSLRLWEIYRFYRRIFTGY